MAHPRGLAADLLIRMGREFISCAFAVGKIRSAEKESKQEFFHLKRRTRPGQAASPAVPVALLCGPGWHTQDAGFPEQPGECILHECV